MKPYHRFLASSIQRQFWFLQNWQPRTTAYHTSCVFCIHGWLDIKALKLAFDDLACQHASLRTTFQQQEELWQCVHEWAGELPKEWAGELAKDWDNKVPIADQVVASQVIGPNDQVVQNFLRLPFRLDHGPLWRVGLWRSGPQEFVLVWSFHHIIVDLRSKEILAQDLARFYQARLSGQALPALPAQNENYVQFALWERQWLQDSATAAGKYFVDHLSPGIEPLALVTDRPRPPLQGFAGARLVFEVESKRAQLLHQLCQKEATKPFLVLLSVWALLLSRYSNSQEVVLGVPFSNRKRKESKNVVGCFVNSLPLAVKVEKKQPFARLLSQIRASMLGHHRHQELGLERIVAFVNPPRDSSRSPLFQAGFTFEPLTELSLGDAQVTSIKSYAGGAQLDLYLTFWPQGEGFGGQVEYATALFDEFTISQMVESYFELLDQILDPLPQGQGFASIACSQLRIVNSAQEHRVLNAFNATEVNYSPPLRLPQLFLNQVAKNEHAVAVRYGEQSLTFCELRAKACALSNQLRESIFPGEHVGIFMQRSLEMVVSLLAVPMADGVYVPIDPEYPSPRIEQMLEDSRPRIVLTHAPVMPRWKGEKGLLQLVDIADLKNLKKTDHTFPDPRPIPGNALYTLFTSGSTGRPKGATNTHQGVINRILWMQQALKLDAQDVVLQKTPFSFDVSTWEFFWPLVTGAMLEVLPPEEHRDPSALCRIIRERKVTTLHFVPSMLGAFLEYPLAEQCTSLRRIVASGEALSAELVRRCYQIIPHAELHNLYGPTEAAVDVTWWECSNDLLRDPVPIGKPIANTKLYVLDHQQQPVPVGVPGELYIGGVQVALGYVNRPDLTVKRFVPDRFSANSSSPVGCQAALYRTGDLVRWTADGNLIFLGRLDHQVKLRGLRIELGEIESVIERFPMVRQCVVVVRSMEGKNQQLVAYLVVDKSFSDNISREALLSAHVTQLLPTYMVPDSWVFLPQLPLSPNGKIDRNALPEPPTKVQLPSPDGPLLPLEKWLQEQCQDLFGACSMDRASNFFEMGGTSIALAQLAGRIMRHHNLEIRISQIFEYPTISSLAKHLTSCLAGDREISSSLDETQARAQLRRQRHAIRRPGKRE